MPLLRNIIWGAQVWKPFWESLVGRFTGEMPMRQWAQAASSAKAISAMCVTRVCKNSDHLTPSTNGCPWLRLSDGSEVVALGPGARGEATLCCKHCLSCSVNHSKVQLKYMLNTLSSNFLIRHICCAQRFKI